MENIIKDKINDFGNYLLSICKSDDSKILIENKIKNLKLYEILLFISFLQPDKINGEIDLLIKNFNLQDNEEVKNKILNYILYFIEVKKIINK